MTRSRQNRYTDEFKSEAVKLVLDGNRKPSEIAKDLGIATSTLNCWVRKAKAANPDLHMQADIYKELQELKKENKILRQERDILKKATALFARTSS